MKRQTLILYAAAFVVAVPLLAQKAVTQTLKAVTQTQKTVAERLGYDAGAKLLIVHADDLGVSHSTNRAFAVAHGTGQVNSGSIMVPAPWFPEIAEYARKHPDADLGLHLTLTSEWSYLHWRGVLSPSETPSLYDEEGFLPSLAEPVAANARIEEVEAELRAQVERALAFGIHPTHLDSHMGTLFQTPELLGVYLRVAESYHLPVLLPAYLKEEDWFADVDLRGQEMWATSWLTATPDVPASGWERFYVQGIEALEPGITEFVIHVAYDDEEMKAVTAGYDAWGSAWRQRDLDFFTSRRFHRLLEKHDVKLVTWRQIGALLGSGE